jgi:hypothetical protein
MHPITALNKIVYVYKVGYITVTVNDCLYDKHCPFFMNPWCQAVRTRTLAGSVEHHVRSAPRSASCLRRRLRRYSRRLRRRSRRGILSQQHRRRRPGGSIRVRRAIYCTDVINRDECNDEHSNENYQSGTHVGGLIEGLRW